MQTLGKIIAAAAALLGVLSILFLVIAGFYKEGSKENQKFIYLSGQCRNILLITSPAWIIALIFTIGK